jgi:hypothetical protein
MDKPKPYITAALLCENLIEAKDGSLTVIRIADRLEYVLEGVPAGLKPMLNIKGLLALKSGPVKGEFVVVIRLIRPNGMEKEPITLPPITLLGGDQGQNVILNIALGVEEEGLHWFDVYFDGDLLTRIPLMVLRKQMPGLGK